MPRVNLLIADDVGLGKTIEAGMVVQELLARQRIRRIPIVCPASLQRQWADEMLHKFALRFSRGPHLNKAELDAVMVRRLKDDMVDALGRRRFPVRRVEAMRPVELAGVERQVLDGAFPRFIAHYLADLVPDGDTHRARCLARARDVSGLGRLVAK